MPQYPLGKGVKYEQYIHDTLAVMFEAGVRDFTLDDLVSWSGAAASRSLREVCDSLALQGWLWVIEDGQRGVERRYLLTLCWIGYTSP